MHHHRPVRLAATQLSPTRPATLDHRHLPRTIAGAGTARQRLLWRIPTMIVELDGEGTVLFANATVVDILGYGPRELEGKNFWQILCPGRLRRQLQGRHRRLYVANVGSREVVLRTKGGELKAVSWRFSANGRTGAAHRIIAVGTDVSRHRRVEHELAESVAKLRKVLEGTIEAIAMTVELRDPYTAGHQRRVATLACAITRDLGLSEEQSRAVRLAGTIHDIGKIAVPLEVLAKRDALSAEELELLQAHAETGYAILKTVDFPWPIADIVHEHHERIDGSGYPLRLQGGQILLEAKILAVCDVVESMAGPRPYREALGIDVALYEITRGRGQLYEPEVVDACLRVVGDNWTDWE